MPKLLTIVRYEDRLRSIETAGRFQRGERARLDLTMGVLDAQAADKPESTIGRVLRCDNSGRILGANKSDRFTEATIVTWPVNTDNRATQCALLPGYRQCWLYTRTHPTITSVWFVTAADDGIAPIQIAPPMRLAGMLPYYYFTAVGPIDRTTDVYGIHIK